MTRKQADARRERGDDRLAPLEQVAPDEHGRAREGGGGTSCPGARAQLCARAPSPAHAACAQQIHPRPRPVGQAHGLGLVVRADGDARAARQSSTSTPPPRASAPPPTVRALPSSLPKFGDGRKSRSSYGVRSRYVVSCCPAAGAYPAAKKTDNLSCVAPFTRSDEPGPF